jgi:Zn ribbon nucleic-acid-binding protein
MRKGRCPKCNATDLRSKTGSLIGWRGVLSGVGFWRGTAKISTYVCVKCGYVEDYVNDSKDLEAISEKWESVNIENTN